MRISTVLAAGALLAFALSGQLGVFDLLTVSLILAGWAVAAAWLCVGPRRRTIWRAVLARLMARSAETIKVLEPDQNLDGRVRVGLNDLLARSPSWPAGTAGHGADGVLRRVPASAFTVSAGGNPE